MVSHNQDNHHDMMICEGGGAFKSKSTYSEASHTQSAELQNYEKKFQGKPVYEELDHFVQCVGDFGLVNGINKLGQIELKLIFC